MFVNQLNELLDRIDLGHKKFILCGYSMGGAVSAEFAKEYPDKIKKLILISPAGINVN